MSNPIYLLTKSIQRLEEVKDNIKLKKRKLDCWLKNGERKSQVVFLMRQGEVLHAQGIKHQQKIISLVIFYSL